VLALDSEYLPALNNLAYLYHRSGDIQQAEVCYRQVLTLRPEDDSAHYMLASLLGTPLDHAPDSYVRHFFDAYAEGFEKSLVDGLGYDNPRQLHRSEGFEE
jgi:predicted TPR repeat methyltransferase